MKREMEKRKMEKEKKDGIEKEEGDREEGEEGGKDLMISQSCSVSPSVVEVSMVTVVVVVSMVTMEVGGVGPSDWVCC